MLDQSTRSISVVARDRSAVSVSASAYIDPVGYKHKSGYSRSFQSSVEAKHIQFNSADKYLAPTKYKNRY